MTGSDCRTSNALAPHGGINYARIPIGGDLGGLIAVVGSTVCLLLALPDLRPFFCWSLLTGAVSGILLILVRRLSAPPHLVGRRFVTPGAFPPACHMGGMRRLG